MPNREADEPAERRQQQPLREELALDLRGRRTDRLAHPDLPRPLPHATSMMFITPMPPRSRVTTATARKNSSMLSIILSNITASIAVFQKLIRLDVARIEVVPLRENPPHVRLDRPPRVEPDEADEAFSCSMSCRISSVTCG